MRVSGAQSWRADLFLPTPEPPLLRPQVQELPGNKPGTLVSSPHSDLRWGWGVGPAQDSVVSLGGFGLYKSVSPSDSLPL